MEFVRTNAPLPKTQRKAPTNVNRKSKYDFAGMKIGDSDLTNDFVDGKKALLRLQSAISAYKKRSGDKRCFSVRLYKDEELNCEVLGVWCLEPRAPRAKKADEAVATTTDADQDQAEGQE